MKKMNIQVHTTTTEPEGYVPFSMVFGSTWRAFEAGEINREQFLIMNILYKRVNPYNGLGYISYTEVCIALKRKPTKLSINAINKLMVDLRDEHHLIWFPEHKGYREFPYLIADLKLAKKDEKEPTRWVDIKPNLQTQKQNDSRGSSPPIATIQPEAQPRCKPPEQRSEGRNSGGITHIGEDITRRYGRPPQTNTDNQK